MVDIFALDDVAIYGKGNQLALSIVNFFLALPIVKLSLALPIVKFYQRRYCK